MTAARKPDTPPTDPNASLRDRLARVARLHLEAVEITPSAKAEQTVQRWFSHLTLDLDEEAGLKAAALALVMAMELESFTPSLSGAMAVDRLARRRKFDPDEETALRALQAARFSLFRVRGPLGEDLFAAEDLATAQTFTLYDDGLPPAAIGIPLAGLLCPLAADRQGPVGMMLPLDDAGLAVAMGFVRPGRGIAHGHRCAAAVYRHVVRHGGPVIMGLNELPDAEPDDEEDEAPSPFTLIVAGLVLQDRWRDPPADILDEVRRLASTDAVLECLYKAVIARSTDGVEPGRAFRRLAEVMIEALHLRALAGSGSERTPLDALAQAIDREIALNGYPRKARDLFDDIRRAIAAAKPKQEGEDLTRVIEKIRALRAKTLDQGCTEEETIAAANKVAELLDRYGLSLGEVDLREQACRGFGIGSNRKRMGPIDDCVQPVGQFCDCRAWHETAADGTIRTVFFGLPADVEAAAYLYERIVAAFQTETETFQAAGLYRRLAGGEQAKATKSFQLGLARGITGRLQARKAEREATQIKASGRDLVPVKASIVEEELAKLGMAFTSQETHRSRLVLAEAYAAGQVAGRQFEAEDVLDATS